jgi:hypothetical protein
MGWGFLMGAGKGFQGAASSYGRIMDQKRANDFQMQKDELQFERTKALEDLRAQNQKARDKTQRGYQLEDQGLLRKQQLEDYERGRQDKKDDLASAFESYTARKRVDNQYAIALENKRIELKNKVTDENKEQVIASLMELFGENPTPQEKYVIASVKTGVDLNSLIKDSGGSTKATGELISTLSELGMATGAIDEKSTPEDVQQFFTSVIPNLKLGQASKSKPLVELPGPEAVTDMSKDILAGDSEALQSYLMLAPKSKAMVDMELEKLRVGKEAAESVPVERPAAVMGRNSGSVLRSASGVGPVGSGPISTLN